MSEVGNILAVWESRGAYRMMSLILQGNISLPPSLSYNWQCRKQSHICMLHMLPGGSVGCGYKLDFLTRCETRKKWMLTFYFFHSYFFLVDVHVCHFCLVYYTQWQRNPLQKTIKNGLHQKGLVQQNQQRWGCGGWMEVQSVWLRHWKSGNSPGSQQCFPLRAVFFLIGMRNYI